MHTYTDTRKTELPELTENGHFRLFASNGKRKTEMGNFLLFAAYGNEKQKFVFLGQQTLNDNRRLLFQQTCPSMNIKVPGIIYRQISKVMLSLYVGLGTRTFCLFMTRVLQTEHGSCSL